MDRNSPKAVIKEAYVQKIIINENNWLLMINDRNMTSNVYKEEMAEEIQKINSEEELEEKFNVISHFESESDEYASVEGDRR